MLFCEVDISNGWTEWKSYICYIIFLITNIGVILKTTPIVLQREVKLFEKETKTRTFLHVYFVYVFNDDKKIN
jgi:hypothetical protein